MTSLLSKRTPFKRGTFETSKPDTVPPLLDRSDGTTGKIGNPHIFHGIEHIEPSVPTPARNFRFPLEGNFIHGLSGEMAKQIDTKPYKYLRRRGETIVLDDIDVNEMAEIEGGDYQTDLRDMGSAGPIFGLQQVQPLDINRNLRELKSEDRTVNADNDTGTTGAGLSKYDYRMRVQNSEEVVKPTPNPYESLGK